MQSRELGLSGLKVPPVVLGGNVFGWTLREADAFHQLDRALEAGLNFVDTADVYSRWVPGHQGGESETVLGHWFARSGRRSQMVVATKVGIEMGEGKSGLSARYIEQAVEDSLRRLGTDYIDLYQAHRDDSEIGLEETLGAFDRLVKAGKVRWLGASNYGAVRLELAIETSRTNSLAAYVSLQPHYNLLERKTFESELLPVARKHHLGVIPYFSLAAGFLTGKYKRDGGPAPSPRAASLQKYQNERGFAIVDVLNEIAAEHHATAARVAPAWLRAQPGVTAPIASATSDSHLDDLIAAATLELDEESLRRLNEISAPAPA